MIFLHVYAHRGSQFIVSFKGLVCVWVGGCVRVCMLACVCVIEGVCVAVSNTPCQYV